MRSHEKTHDESMPPLEQHFIDESHLSFLDDMGIAGRNVIEWGAGQGGLTLALLARGAAQVEAWEIDPTLEPPCRDERLVWRVRDILSATPSDAQGKAVAAFPPYSTLPHIFTVCHEVSDLLLMVPDRWLPLCWEKGMRSVTGLAGTLFVPPARGTHRIVVRGWAK